MSKSFDTHKPLDLSEGVTHKGSRSWAITESKAACRAMIAGDKTALGRILLPIKMWAGDVVYVVQRNSGGKVACRFTVTDVERGRKDWIWLKYSGELCMRYEDFCKLSTHYSTVGIIRFEKVQQPMKRAIYIEDLGLDTSPMWFTVVTPPKKF